MSDSASDQSNEKSAYAAAIAAALRKCAKRLRRKGENLKGDLAECDTAEELRRDGELLKAALPNLKRGMKEAVVQDFFSGDSDATRTIELDPARNPRETVNRLFKKAAKLERGREKIVVQIEINNDKIENIESLLTRIEKAIDTGREDELGEDFFAACVDAGVKEEKGKSGKLDVISGKPSRPLGKKEQLREQLMKSVRVFSSHDGIEILVGKSNRDNDVLSFRLARGNDWWFHLAPAPGSHVLARCPDGGALPQETLLDAATLAVYFSKMRGAVKTEVHYTQAKNVRRIKGAPPGKVRLERNQTLSVRVEPERLERLLKG